MRLRGKIVDQIATEDLVSLVENGVPESRILDYKLQLPGAKSAEKKEFLADVISFANTAGGVIVFGALERKDAAAVNTGELEAIPGLSDWNDDAERLRLTSMLNDGISPALGGSVRFHTVGAPGGGSSVLLLGVPQSFAGPHMISFEKSNRFYRRAESGKYLPDVQEIRQMFNEQGQWSQAAELFREKRLARVGSGSVGELLDTHSPLFFHILPLGRLDGAISLSGRYEELLRHLYPPGISGANGRYNVDGIMGFHQRSQLISAYTQLFRFGGLEGYDTENVRPLSNSFDADGTKFEAHHMLRSAIDWFPKGVEFLSNRLDVVPPYALGVAVKGVRGSIIPVKHGWDQGAAIDVDDIVLPLTVIHETNADTVRDAVWSLFDVVWQSAGLSVAPRKVPQ
ncbi:MAG: ATP-binding protein [Gemmatimonadaceae bacterium]|nr:ATP-binding protein [Gemmatimonadaceae bacterium]